MWYQGFVAGVVTALGATLASARYSPNERLGRLSLSHRRAPVAPHVETPLPKVRRRTELQYYNDRTSAFYVDGTKIPQVDFDVGESYAGLIPVDASKPEQEQQKNFFWFFPTVNPAGKDDLIIWFNGGPGCSSLEGLLQENGPFKWQYGTYKPVPNAWSWHKLANVIWVEYPIGAGFSSGNVTATNHAEAADQFVGFWKNFVDTFGGLKNKNIFVSGESYAGVYVPYVGAAMLEKNDTTYFNVKGALYYDPEMPYWADLGLEYAAFPAFYRYWENVFGLPDSAKRVLETDNREMGLDEYMNTYLTYPPPTTAWPFTNYTPEYDILRHFLGFVNDINPCFNVYHIFDQCPIVWDVLGFPSTNTYSPPNSTIYFNDPAVRRAIHAPEDYPQWIECQSPVFVNETDNYNSTDHEIKFRTLVERTNNVHIGSGVADFIYPSNSTALSIQRVTWNGKQGFQQPPSEDLLIPFFNNTDGNVANWAGSGVQGSVHTERGFTHSTVKMSGHMIPQYAPSVAFRGVEHMLGRVDSLTSGAPWSVNISTSFAWPY